MVRSIWVTASGLGASTEACERARHVGSCADAAWGLARWASRP